MKKRKNILISIILIIIILSSLFFIFKFNKPNKKQLKNKYIGNCLYSYNDGYKKTINKFKITTDEYLLVKAVDDITTLDYDNNELYEEAKNYFRNNKNDLYKYDFDDKKMDIVMTRSIPKKALNDFSYNEYIKNLDKKFVCDKLNVDKIKYVCKKNDKTPDYEVEEILNINSNNIMDVDRINKKVVLKYFDKSLYLKSKKEYKNIYEKKYNDSDYTVTYNYVQPIVDQNGKRINININNYIKNLKKYECKQK